MKNIESFLQIALGLEKPWYIVKSWYEKDSRQKLEFHIKVSYDLGDKNNLGGRYYDTREKTWRHLNLFEHRCYIHCDVPRIKTDDGQTRQLKVPWAREGSGFTLLFESFCLMLVQSEMTVQSVASIVKEYPQRIWTIIKHWVRAAYHQTDQSNVKRIGIDETSSKKGHSYITVAVDIDTRNVLFATPGKGADTVGKLKEHLVKKGVMSEKITDVCMDMSPAFIGGMMKNFPNAAITFDKFHVIKLLNETMDEYRRLVLKEHKTLKWQKYTFLKKEKRLSLRQKQELSGLIELLPGVGEAYRLKLLFNDFWEFTDKESGAGFLAYWCDLAEAHGSHVFHKFANMIKSHWSGIVNYLQSQIANGILEGINNKIQLAKRRARGYRNIDNFIDIIYLIASDLKFNFPHSFI